MVCGSSLPFLRPAPGHAPLHDGPVAVGIDATGRRLGAERATEVDTALVVGDLASAMGVLLSVLLTYTTLHTSIARHNPVGGYRPPASATATWTSLARQQCSDRMRRRPGTSAGRLRIISMITLASAPRSGARAGEMSGRPRRLRPRSPCELRSPRVSGLSRRASRPIVWTDMARRKKIIGRSEVVGVCPSRKLNLELSSGPAQRSPVAVGSVCGGPRQRSGWQPR